MNTEVAQITTWQCSCDAKYLTLAEAQACCPPFQTVAWACQSPSCPELTHYSEDGARLCASLPIKWCRCGHNYQFHYNLKQCVCTCSCSAFEPREQ